MASPAGFGLLGTCDPRPGTVVYPVVSGRVEPTAAPAPKGQPAPQGQPAQGGPRRYVFGAGPSRPSEVVCGVCGRAFEPAQFGRLPTRCPECRAGARGGARALVRDDGARFPSVAQAMAAAGYRSRSSFGRRYVDEGRPWRDGHVYRWEDGD